MEMEDVYKCSLIYRVPCDHSMHSWAIRVEIILTFWESICPKRLFALPLLRKAGLEPADLDK
jgi:hypothetical protein